MGKVAIVLQNISTIIKKDDRLIKRGKNYILTGHKKPEFIASKEHKFGTPNHYAVEQVEAMKDYFKIVKVG